MERPKKIDDKEVLDYIEHLEKQLRNYSAETSFVKTYMALKKQNDDLAELYIKATISIDSINEKDDKLFDRFIKYLDKAPILTDTIKKLSQEINPETLKRVDKFINKSGVSVEEMLNS